MIVSIAFSPTSSFLLSSPPTFIYSLSSSLLNVFNMPDTVEYFRDENIECVEYSLSQKPGKTENDNVEGWCRWGHRRKPGQAVQFSQEGIRRISWSRWHWAETWRPLGVTRKRNRRTGAHTSLCRSTAMKRKGELSKFQHPEVHDPRGWEVLTRKRPARAASETPESAKTRTTCWGWGVLKDVEQNAMKSWLDWARQVLIGDCWLL